MKTLYKTITKEHKLIVKDAPFTGASPITVYAFAEITEKLAEVYAKRGETFVQEIAQEHLLRILQNGDGPDLSPETEYEETRFGTAYYSDDMRDFDEAFSNDMLFAYNRITWDEDGEWDFTDDASPTKNTLYAF